MPSDITARAGRQEALSALAAVVCGKDLPHPTRVAIDGITASGKSTLARELAEQVDRSGRPVIHLTMDGYHHQREHRYRQGRMSAVGYYEDAYDFGAFVEGVLVPLGPKGDRRYRERIIDLDTDEPVTEDRRLAPADAVVIVDGSFLQRPDVHRFWDVRVFVDTSFAVALERGVAREAASMGGADQAREAYERRYHAAARLYLERARPKQGADVVVDNNDLAHPVVSVAIPANARRH